MCLSENDEYNRSWNIRMSSYEGFLAPGRSYCGGDV